MLQLAPAATIITACFDEQGFRCDKTGGVGMTFIKPSDTNRVVAGFNL